MSHLWAAYLLVQSIVIGPSEGITLEQRINAQKTILRVYLSHQDGLKQLPDDVTLDELARRKVRRYLELSVVLENRWKAIVTPAMLRTELERIMRNSRSPERLQELFASLEHEPLIIAECLVRPVLVERLATNFQVHEDNRVNSDDERNQRRAQPLGEQTVTFPDAVTSVMKSPISSQVMTALSGASSSRRSDDFSGPNQSLGEWSGDQRGSFKAIESPRPLAYSNVYDRGIQEGQLGCSDDDSWDNGRLDQIHAFGSGTAVWTGTEMLIWPGGLRYDPVTDNWSRMSTVSEPAFRSRHTAVWSGTHMIVWGGDQGSVFFNSGALYNPVTDMWSPITTVNAPQARREHTAIWTGTEMIVWGGSSTGGALNSGGRYDPVGDIWTATTMSGAPSPHVRHTAVWTDSEMVVWNGFNPGGRYDPVTDTWRAVGSTGQPTPRSLHTAVWTGSLMLIWGGLTSGSDLVDAAYDPIADSWRPITREGSPVQRSQHSAVWTGSRMLVWGGQIGFEQIGTGGQYNPETDSWSTISLLNAPEPRSRHAWVWTGHLLVVWGGMTDVSSRNLSSGGRYDPLTDTWTPTSVTSNLPQPRWMHTGVWTGTEMIIWGGSHFSAYRADGYRYDPVTDFWSRTSLIGAPTRRAEHTAIWTGSEMIIWGGESYDIHLDEDQRLNTGARYSPLTDTWIPMSVVAAPVPRKAHTAVWTGEKMIVWGGWDRFSIFASAPALETGGIYDPATDTWTEMSAHSVPEGRFGHSAIWTGSEVIVWGGYNGLGTTLATGGRYEPRAGLWRELTVADGPGPRVYHTAVWSGDEMIVWGGDSRFATGQTLDTGGRYNPTTDSWRATSELVAPEPRVLHSAIWTGKEMMIWGGLHDSITYLSSGGRYDPGRDLWRPTTTTEAPAPRTRHSMVWTGTHAIIWGGIGGESTGGRYVIFNPPDNDGDGLTSCAGDCDDSDPLMNAEADEICDGKDNDCDGVVPAEEEDSDGDLYSVCAGDCDDSNPSVHAGAADLPGNILDEDCNGEVLCHPDDDWKNHGHFVGCVSRVCGALVSGGLLGAQECEALIRKAARLDGGGS